MRLLPPLLVAALIAAPSPAEACSCDDPDSPHEARDRADAVVEARLVDELVEVVYEEYVEDDGTVVEEPVSEMVTYTFEVDVSWKGSLEAGAQFGTQSSTECCECERHYSGLGTSWLLYLSEREDGFWGDGGTCSRTTRLENADCDLEALDGPDLQCDGEAEAECGGCAALPAEPGPVAVVLALLFAITRRRAARSSGS